MAELAGRPGTWGGLALRAGQFTFAAACICVMSSAPGFANYTAFCYLIASMGLQALWSVGLACLDCYGLILRKDLQQAFLLSLFVVGDWVTAVLSFAAASSAGGVVVLFHRDVHFCSRDPQLPCGRFGSSHSIRISFLGVLCYICYRNVLPPCFIVNNRV